MATLIFSQNGKLTTKFIKSFGTHAANLLTTINEKDCISDEILKTHTDLIDEKVITAMSPTHYNLDLAFGSHTIHLSYRDYKDAHRDYSYFRLMIATAIAYRNSRAKSVGCLILARYSTPDNSWQSAYINDAVAAKHIKENAQIQFSGEWSEEDVIAHYADIQLAIDQREQIIEIGEWSVEIEYGETIITE